MTTYGEYRKAIMIAADRGIVTCAHDTADRRHLIAQALRAAVESGIGEVDIIEHCADGSPAVALSIERIGTDPIGALYHFRIVDSDAEIRADYGSREHVARFNMTAARDPEMTIASEWLRVFAPRWIPASIDSFEDTINASIAFITEHA